jgi:putative spermidine/putrescine transport system permease protein
MSDGMASGRRDRCVRSGGGVPIAALPAFLVVGSLTVAGVVGVVRTSLRDGIASGAETGVGAWRRVLVDPSFRDAVGFTIWVAVASTTIAVIGALAIATALRRGGRSRVVMAVPVAAPHLVIASLAVLWLAPGGVFDRLVGRNPGWLIGDRGGWGIVLVYVAKEIPFLTLLALAALDDATSELDATAAVLGANGWQRLRDVVVPRLMVPLGAGALVVTAFVVGAVEVPTLVGPTRPEMLGTYAIGVVRIDGPRARADAAVAQLVAALLVATLGSVAGLATWLRTRR